MAIVLTSSVGAWPGGASQSVRAAGSPGAAMRIGKSVGSPTTGHLIGGARLADAPYLRVVPTYAAGDVRWGLGPLVSMIDRRRAAGPQATAGAVLSVGHPRAPAGATSIGMRRTRAVATRTSPST